MERLQSRGKFPAVAPYLLLLAGVLLFYRAVLFAPGYGIPWDLPGFHLPHAVFLSESLHKGAVPYWEPYAYCGRPFAANPQTQTFYPFRIASALAGSPDDVEGLYYLLELEEILHVFLGAALAFWLGGVLNLPRPAALLVGFVYSLGCFFASQAEHIGAVEAAAWMPLVWGAVVRLRYSWRRKDFGLLVAGLCLTLLAGFPPQALITILSSAVLAAAFVLTGKARPRGLPTLLGGMALAACICAVALVPAVQLGFLSIARYRSEWRGTGGGVPLRALWTLIQPDHFGIFDLSRYAGRYEPTLMYLYCGIPALALAILGAVFRRSREKTALCLLLGVSAVCMLGDATPFGAWFFRLLPEMVRGGYYPQFWLSAFGLGVAVLAGIGLSDRARGVPSGYLIAAACAVDLILASSGRPINTASLDRDPIVTDVSFEGRPGILAALRRMTSAAVPPARIDTIDDSIAWALTPAITRLPIATGYDPMALLRFTQARLAVADGQRWGAYYQAQHPASPMLAAMSVKYLLSRKAVAGAANLRVAREFPGRIAYENIAALPRFYFTRRVTCAAGLEEAARLVRRPEWNPAEEAVVECPPARAGSVAQGAVTTIDYEPNMQVLETSAPGEAFLATSEAHYPAWEARVDGKEVPLYYTNAAFRGIFVPAGKHRVEMRYSPRLFVISAMVSLAGLAALAALAGMGLRRERLKARYSVTASARCG